MERKWIEVKTKEELKDLFDKNISTYTQAMVLQDEIIPIGTFKLAEAILDIGAVIVYEEA